MAIEKPRIPTFEQRVPQAKQKFIFDFVGDFMEITGGTMSPKAVDALRQRLSEFVHNVNCNGEDDQGRQFRRFEYYAIQNTKSGHFFAGGNGKRRWMPTIKWAVRFANHQDAEFVARRMTKHTKIIFVVGTASYE